METKLINLSFPKNVERLQLRLADLSQVIKFPQFLCNNKCCNSLEFVVKTFQFFNLFNLIYLLSSKYGHSSDESVSSLIDLKVT